MNCTFKFSEETMQELCDKAATNIKKELSGRIYRECEDKSFNLLDTLDVKAITLNDLKEILDSFAQ